MSRPSTEFGMIVTKLLRCFGWGGPHGIETGKALFRLYHSTPPSPTASTARHLCEFTACGMSDVAAPLPANGQNLWAEVLTDRGLLARRRLHDRRQVGRDHRCSSTLFRHLPIERVALHRLAADRADQRFHVVRRKLLAVLGAGGARDALIHQRAAEIVGAGLQADCRAGRPHLYPGSLDV